MVFDKIVFEVEEVYRELEGHIEHVTSQTGMKCPHLCSACCRNTEIEATPIEFIPLAAWLYETGKVDEFLTGLDQRDETGYCVLFSPEASKEGKWGCLQYEKRGLICRLFGIGYRLNRENMPELVTCKVMKEVCHDGVSKARLLGAGPPGTVPLFRDYSMRLFGIDLDLSTRLMPINQAIRIAIEKLYFHYAPDAEYMGR